MDAAPLTFRFTPTKEDYIRTVQAFNMRLKSMWFVLIIAGIMFIAGAANLIMTWQQGLSFPYILLTVIFPFFLLFLVFGNSFMIGRQVGRNERFTTEVTWELSAEEVALRTRFAEAKMDWGSFAEFLETKSYFLVVYSANKRQFQFVPKRAFASPEQEQEFRDLLGQHIRGGRKTIREFAWAPPVWLSALVIFGSLFLCIIAVAAYNFQQQIK